jgi:hypothetical protein
VGQPILLNRVFERAHDMGLPDQIIEGLRPVLARENFVAHVRNLVRRRNRENRKHSVHG